MSNMDQNLPIEIDVAAVRAIREAGEGAVLVDCREQNEYDYVRIEGATLLPMSELARRAGELDEHRGARIVVYCHFGGRSLQVATWLRERGFAQAQSMAGGIDQWAVEVDRSLPRY
jgi:adenylyltransferase/sulfurtransferase